MIKKIIPFAILTIGLLTIVTCQPKSRTVETSFYFWKTEFRLSNFEIIFLKKHQTQQIYTRVFDVILGGGNQPEPNGVLRWSDTVSVQKINELNIQIIPTIFIANKIFESNQENLSQKIFQFLQKNIPNNIKFREIQIDCDWTNSTRDRYFAFLEQFKTISKLDITATIRLHQVKFFAQTGVPPLARGTLMAYNVGNMETADGQNSILNLNDLGAYLQNFDRYPMALDVALPIYEWGVVLRDGQVAHLMNGLSEARILGGGDLFQKMGQNVYEMQRDAYFEGQYFYKNDRFRLESISPTTLEAAAKKLSPHLKNRALRLTFFHLDSVNLSRYDEKIFQQIEICFQR